MVSITCLIPKAWISRTMECTEMDTEVVEYYTTLILKLNIKDVQNPFQRQYHRGQTELFFWSTLLEDTD